VTYPRASLRAAKRANVQRGVQRCVVQWWKISNSMMMIGRGTTLSVAVRASAQETGYAAERFSRSTPCRLAPRRTPAAARWPIINPARPCERLFGQCAGRQGSKRFGTQCVWTANSTPCLSFAFPSQSRERCTASLGWGHHFVQRSPRQIPSVLVLAPSEVLAGSSASRPDEGSRRLLADSCRFHWVCHQTLPAQTIAADAVTAENAKTPAAPFRNYPTASMGVTAGAIL
jgi:hypothetical protein